MDYRTRLLNKKNEIEEDIRKRQEAFRVPIAEMIDEISMYDQHPADIGSELYEREKDYAFLELMEFELKKVNQAIERLDQGLYGICDHCGKEIELGRLDRLINTTLCSACARLRENEVLHHYQELYDNSHEIMDFGKTFQVAGYEFYEE
ncbi:MAG: hypothetical protein GX808_10360 [Syntrophomonadaceae bacterium]|nr:hypothetical protein [Syntrophomonadaceae bacterium]